MSKRKFKIFPPYLPLEVFLVCILVILFGIVYFSTKPDESHFLKLSDGFVYIEDVPHYSYSKQDNPWNSYTKIYGTNMTITEAKNYFYKMAEAKGYEMVLKYIPVIDLLTYKDIREYKDIQTTQKSFLEIEYGLNNIAGISLISPPSFYKNFPYKTEIHIRYNISKKDFAMNYIVVFVLFSAVFSFAYYMVGRSVDKSATTSHTQGAPATS